MLNRQRFIHSLVACATLSFTLVGPSRAEEATPAQAEALVHKAAAYIKANGPDKAYAEFTNGTTFKDLDHNLYVSVWDFSGVNLAHGANAKLVGKNLIGLKDPNGVEFIKEQKALAIAKGSGWTGTFQFLNPTTKKLQDKIAYVERVNDTWIGIGIYK